MNVCPNCSAGVNPESRFCTSCGAPVEGQAPQGSIAAVETDGQVPVRGRLSGLRESKNARKVGAGLVVLALFMAGVLASSAGVMDWLTGKRYGEQELRSEYEKGRAVGENTGYENGLSVGKESGYEDGYRRGKTDGCLAVFSKVRSDSGYGAIVAWDTIWKATRGSYYYTSSSTCG